MEDSPSFIDQHSHQNDHYASPMSLPPPSATPRSVQPRDELSYMNTHSHENRMHHRPSVASKKNMVDLGPPSTVTSYHLSSVDPTTPYTPQTHDTSARVQPSLQNIVSTVNLGCSLDLRKIAQQARNAEYNPKRFAAVIMRIRSPRTTALIFSSGKMVCTGAKSEEDSIQAARRYARVIQKLGFEAKFLDFKIQNMVGSADVNFKIQLEALSMRHKEYCSYEPELFPGLIYRIIKPKIVLLIFNSGKVVLTGAKERREIDEAFLLIHPILKSFRRTNT